MKRKRKRTTLMTHDQYCMIWYYSIGLSMGLGFGLGAFSENEKLKYPVWVTIFLMLAFAIMWPVLLLAFLIWWIEEQYKYWKKGRESDGSKTKECRTCGRPLDSSGKCPYENQKRFPS